jgi:hypothetical protein
MNDESSTPKNSEEGNDDVVSNEFSEDTIVIEDVAENDIAEAVDDLDVSQLVAKLDSKDADEAQHQRDIHRRLEELKDQKEADKNLDSTYNFNLDDDL